MITAGTLRLDPAAKWCVVERTNRIKWPDGPGQAKQVYEYMPSPDGYPVIRHSIFEESKDPPGRYTYRVLHDYDLRPDRSADDSEFMLSAYGLPEPPGVEGLKRTPTYLYLLLSAIVFAAAAGLFGWFHRRRNRRTTAPAVTA